MPTDTPPTPAPDFFCRLYVAGAPDEQALEQSVDAALRRCPPHAGHAEPPVLDWTVRAECRHLPLDDAQEDFTLWRHHIEADAASPSVRFDSYLHTLAWLLAGLRAQGLRVVAACDFEDALNAAAEHARQQAAQQAAPPAAAPAPPQAAALTSAPHPTQMPPAPSLDAVRGVLLGLALGDTLGAPHEGGWLARGLWALLGRTPEGLRRFTDDTQMSLDVAECLLACGGLDQDALARRFARSYQWRRGYGPGAAKVLRRIRAGQPWQQANRSAHPQGSWGNGAAMRAPVLALWPFATPQALAQAARQSAEVTHAHPQGMAGAVLLALATRALMADAHANAHTNTRTNAPALLAAARAALTDEEGQAFDPALRAAAAWLAQGDAPSPRQVARTLGHGITARSSCVTALYVALRHLDQPFEALLRFAIACRGDTDTIAAMAGALWGAWRGASALPALPLEQQARLERAASQLQHRWLDRLPNPII